MLTQGDGMAVCEQIGSERSSMEGPQQIESPISTLSLIASTNGYSKVPSGKPVDSRKGIPRVICGRSLQLKFSLPRISTFLLLLFKENPFFVQL